MMYHILRFFLPTIQFLPLFSIQVSVVQQNGNQLNSRISELSEEHLMLHNWQKCFRRIDSRTLLTLSASLLRLLLREILRFRRRFVQEDIRVIVPALYWELVVSGLSERKQQGEESKFYW